MGPVQYIFIFFGRACLSIIFILSGIHKILNWEAVDQHLQEKLGQMLVSVNGIGWLESLVDLGLIYSTFCIFTAIFLELLGGICLLFGLKVRFAAIILILFLIPTTLIMHNFWGLHGAEFQLQLVMFLKNIAILGGLFLISAYGSVRKTIGPT